MNEVQLRIDEFPTEEVEKARRNLLISSSLAIIITSTGAVPTKVEAIGVEFSRLEQRWIYIFVCVLVFYFLLKFILRLRYVRSRIMLLRSERRVLAKLLAEYDPISRAERPRQLYLDYTMRRLFEDELPKIVGVLAIAVSIYAAISGKSVLQKPTPPPPFTVSDLSLRTTFAALEHTIGREEHPPFRRQALSITEPGVRRRERSAHLVVGAADGRGRGLLMYTTTPN